MVAALSGAVVVGVIVHGLLFGGGGGGGASRTSGVQAQSPHADSSRASATDAGRFEAEHTRSGAVAAAVSFVCSGQELLAVDPLSAEEMIRRMATTSTADEQVRTTAARLRELRERLADGSGPITLVQGVIASRVDSYATDRARVALWNVSVIARDGVASPQATWAISTLDLVWEQGRWRLSYETVQPGPAPLLDDSAPPATAAQLQSSLAGFTEVAGAR
jgi:hypothetical protein